MGSACEWTARTDAQERIRAQSVTMIGPSVYLVRPLGTMVLHNVGTAIVVLVGCFSDAEQVVTLLDTAHDSAAGLLTCKRLVPGVGVAPRVGIGNT
jgi:hypothetical protein